ncbi:MAG: hypothetical protein IBJ18_02025 [Phycisphaerales bacterium]|nr:hypothetical protein [Phycisphaerales bacterium]
MWFAIQSLSATYVSGSQEIIDRFNRVVIDSWERYAGTATKFEHKRRSYDDRGLTTTIRDLYYEHKDSVEIKRDTMGRITKFRTGEAGGGTGDEIVTGDKRTDEDFTLRVDGKATFNTISMNESFWGGATESRTLDKAGKVTARDTNNDATADYTPTYNDANMLTADGRHYTYTYDMLGRVVTAKDSTATTTIKEYKWDPGCTLLAWREDVSVPADGLDGSDAWYYSVASAEGQAKATIRGSDTDAKELYTYHAAGVLSPYAVRWLGSWVRARRKQQEHPACARSGLA